MSDFFPPRKKQEPLELQLTAMIDVFSMIVIFLIFGTVFGAADIVIPKDLAIPKSHSKEGVDSAPRLLIHNGQVTLNLNDEKFPLSAFKTEESRKAVGEKLKPVLAEFKARRKGNEGSGSNPINLLADQNAPYEEIYDVVSAFRQYGFDSVYFVATGGKAE
jgi:biopolymer transport protein ExbD